MAKGPKIPSGSMGVEIDVFGETQVSRDLQRFSDRATDARPVLRDVASDLRKESEQQFDSEGGHASGGWTPLKEKTIAAKRAAGQDLRILHATHLLRDSLTQQGSPAGIEEIDRDGLKWGSAVEYGPVHQEGAPAANIPQRRPFELTTLTRELIVKKIQRFMVEGSVPG